MGERDAADASGAKPSASTRAEVAIRDLVIDGSYRPGDRLPAERELSRAMELSRPALREGIRALVESGLLETRRSAGVYVANIDLADLFAVRRALEPLAAGLAAEHRTAEEAAQLFGLAGELRGNLAEPAEFAAVDARVHALVAKASRNPLLAVTLARLSDLAAVSRGRTALSLAARDATRRDIGRLALAVGDGDGRAAADAMTRHLDAMEAAAAAEARTGDAQVLGARQIAS